MIRLTPPTVPRVVSSGWGAPRAYRGGWHAGLDFPAAKGTPMLAAADGVVSYVRHSTGAPAGKFVVIDHGEGISSRYLHADTITVQKGQRVSRGQSIGTVGDTGTSRSAPHVHFDVKMLDAPLQEYISRFGEPTTKFSSYMSPWGHGVPAEPLVSGAVYRPGVLEKALAKGVSPYKAAIGALGLVAVAGAGWLFYRYLTR